MDTTPDCVKLPPDWRRYGIVVVVDSVTGQLLGSMGRATWDRQLAKTRRLTPGDKPPYFSGSD